MLLFRHAFTLKPDLVDGNRTIPPHSSNSQGGVWSGRWDSNPRPSPWQGDALPLSHFRSLRTPSAPAGRRCAEGQSRTGDTGIFSAVLYHLSYLGIGLSSYACGRPRVKVSEGSWRTGAVPLILSLSKDHERTVLSKR